MKFLAPHADRRNHTLIHVMIADAYAFVRAGVKATLSPLKDILLAGEAASGMEIIRLLRHDDADVLVLDINLPDKNGIEILKQIKKEKPETAILVFSDLREDQYAIRSLKAGAAGYLHKRCHPDEFVQAIRKIASGQKYISPTLAQELARNISGETPGSLHDILSDREYQTLVLIGQGKSTSDISRELSLSAKTISEYRTRLLAKMNMKNSSELMHYAISNGLVDPAQHNN